MAPKLVLYTLAALLTSTRAMLPIEVDSNRFIKPSVSGSSDNSVFFMNGVDYQPGGSSGYSADSDSDVLTDGKVCARDATALQNLGVDTLRVYTVNPDLNHDDCMSIFNAAGIYVILDVNSPLVGESINRYEPWTSYYDKYVERVFKVVENFRGYPNTLGFFIGNEIINDEKSAQNSPTYIRAITRDVKNYINARANDGGRYIPVGYSAADVVDLREPTFEYLTCAIDGKDDDVSRIDFFGLNSYEWCSGTSNWQTSNYGETKSTFQNDSVPVFFSEYGCNKNSPRTFDEVDDGLYGGLQDVLSGGLVYEYSHEDADYGLLEINSDNSISLFADFYNLQKQFKNADIPSIKQSDVVDYDIPECKNKNSTSFNFNFNLPDVPDHVDDYIKNGVSVNHTGSIVDVSDYTDLYAKGADISNNDDYYSILDTSSSDASMYLTVPASNLVNSVSGTTTMRTSTTSSSSSATVSSISSAKSKGAAGQLNTGGIGIGLFAVIAALI